MQFAFRGNTFSHELRNVVFSGEIILLVQELCAIWNSTSLFHVYTVCSLINETAIWCRHLTWELSVLPISPSRQHVQCEFDANALQAVPMQIYWHLVSTTIMMSRLLGSSGELGGIGGRPFRCATANSAFGALSYGHIAFTARYPKKLDSFAGISKYILCKAELFLWEQIGCPYLAGVLCNFAENSRQVP